MTAPILPPVDVLDNAVVLAVTASEEDILKLRLLCKGSCWDLKIARSCQEALACLRRNPTPVVFCAERLPDGDWKIMLRSIEGLDRPPNLVVFSNHADDRLWAEVLNLGGFDVLSFPTERWDLFHILSSAWRNWEGHNWQGHNGEGHAAKAASAAYS